MCKPLARGSVGRPSGARPGAQEAMLSRVPIRPPPPSALGNCLQARPSSSSPPPPPRRRKAPQSEAGFTAGSRGEQHAGRRRRHPCGEVVGPSHSGTGFCSTPGIKMLYLIGLGLGDAKDITVKGLEVVKHCRRVYLEAYTSVLTVGKEALEEFYGRELILADRETVEQEADNILKDADLCDVAFLVVGDPFGATTHSDLVLRAVKLGISYRVIHNASIMNAVGCCGLQLYNFGETVSVVFWTDTWKPESFFDKIQKNKQNGMHTLCLLDIKVKEQSLENLMKGKKIYESPRYMNVNQAAEQLLAIVQNRRLQGEEPEVTENTLCVGLARVGAMDQKIASGTLQQMSTVELGGPLHSMIIAGNMHPLEIDMLKLFAVDESSFEDNECQRNT
ncbi:diphthine methyl ester synthase isoform X2 [Dermochelys coriacea]|uniref:diphthine methyl ester synthase isoform X2 n=1 Tax=Dermochelys coriacea TaxID=27794 RepID=UPI0018E78C56|nr:diphthine methyl ester synthase isoform X2 [Dermochelys coriacea]